MSGSLFCADAMKKPVSVWRPVFTGEIEEDKSTRKFLSTEMRFIVLVYGIESWLIFRKEDNTNTVWTPSIATSSKQ